MYTWYRRSKSIWESFDWSKVWERKICIHQEKDPVEKFWFFLNSYRKYYAVGNLFCLLECVICWCIWICTEKALSFVAKRTMFFMMHPCLSSGNPQNQRRIFIVEHLYYSIFYSFPDLWRWFPALWEGLPQIWNSLSHLLMLEQALLPFRTSYETSSEKVFIHNPPAVQSTHSASCVCQSMGCRFLEFTDTNFELLYFHPLFPSLIML